MHYQSLVGFAQFDFSPIVSQGQYGCSEWIMNKISFNKTIDSLKSVSISASLTNKIFNASEPELIYKEKASDQDLKYLQLVLEGILRDLTQILFIEGKINLRVTNNGSLNPSTRCSKSLISVDLLLVEKLLEKSLTRAVDMSKYYEQLVLVDSSWKATPTYFLQLWSNDYIKEISDMPYSIQYVVAQRMNRIAYFTYSEFYRFFIFALSHEVYHLISGCVYSNRSSKYENKADLLGAVTVQFLYRYINYDSDELWKCLFGNAKGIRTDKEVLLEYLYGREIEYIFDFLYKDTGLIDKGASHLSLEDRKKFIQDIINQTHIDKIYKKYEKPIKRFSKK